MNFASNLTMRLYNIFDDNDLLPIVEKISNIKNLVSVDASDINKFNDKEFLCRIDYDSKRGIPANAFTRPDALLVCFNAPRSLTLGEVANEVDKLAEEFNTKDIVFGTAVDDSIEEGNIKVNCILFTKIRWKDKLNEKFYDGLVKCNFLQSLNKIICTPTIASIDVEDIIQISKGEVVGTIAQQVDDLDAEFNINIVSDTTPNQCVFYIFGGEHLSLDTVDKLLSKLKKAYPGINIIYGFGINSDGTERIEVYALLTYRDTTGKSENISLQEESSKVTQKALDENNLVFSVAKYCIDNPISMSNIQNEFGLGFNRVCRILERLERLEIISIKLSNEPRKMLIKDEEEIKRRIYTIK